MANVSARGRTPAGVIHAWQGEGISQKLHDNHGNLVKWPRPGHFAEFGGFSQKASEVKVAYGAAPAARRSRDPRCPRRARPTLPWQRARFMGE